MQVNATKIRSTLGAIVGLLAMFGPDLLNAFGSPATKWGSIGVRIFAALVLVCTNGKAVWFLNKFQNIPDASVKTTVTKE